MDTRVSGPLEPSRALVPTLIFLGMVVAVVSSLGAPMIPTIATRYGVALADAQWSLTITLLVGALATPTMGRLGDGPHRRAVILLSLGAITVGNVLAALPLGFHMLLAGRALQGAGMGLTPLAMATARDALTGERARSAVAMLSITTIAGVGLGYPVTGLVADTLGFEGAFWFGAIVSGAAFVTAFIVLPASKARSAPRLDVIGALLLAAALSALLLGLSRGEQWGWLAARTLGLFAAAIVFTIAWVAHELRTPHPLVELRLVRNESVLAADATAVLAGIGMYLLLATIVRFVQTPRAAGYGFGASVVVAGLVLLPFSMASVVSSRVAAFIARRLAPVLVLPIGCLVFMLAMVEFAFARSSMLHIVIAMTIAGLGVGCTFAAMPGLIVHSVPPHETGSAMSFNQVLRYVGYSTGSALSATILEMYTPAGEKLPTDRGYGAIAWVGCAVWILSAVVSYALPKRGSAAPVDEVLADESVADAVPVDRAERDEAR
jgi:predicted MFS family arabinose efflux permease